MKTADLLQELKRINPYPESVFIPISNEKREALNKLLKDNGYSPDGLYGNWGRYVWDLCVSKAEELMEQFIPDKPDLRDELIKFYKYENKHKWITREIWPPEKIVDEYLKTKDLEDEKKG